jgi:predicted phosphodiesterase
MMKFNTSKVISSVLLSVLAVSLVEQVDFSKLAKAQHGVQDFNFVAAGDWGCKKDAKNTFTMMKKMEPELYLALGDYSYEPSLGCWFNIVEPAGSALKVVVGNHDAEGSLLHVLMNKFHLAKQYYSFDYHNAHFLALSSELNSGDDAGQFNFAKEDLGKAKSNSNIDWIIVFFHRPFYSGSGADNTGMRDMYHPLFQKYGVDLVLTGHAHNYERSYPLSYNDARTGKPLIADHGQFQYINMTGTVFTIVGTGGESIQGVDKKPFLASIYEGFGCLNVQINGGTLNAEFYSPDGKTIDHFMIAKNEKGHEGFDAMNSLHQVVYNRPLK